MSFVTYKEKLKSVSKKLVEVQRPIRILNSIRTPAEWETDLLKSKFKSLPRDPRAHYESIPLGFDTHEKYLELKVLKNEIAQQLGEADELGLLLQRICDEYMQVVEMLKGRGKPEFYRCSRALYGSPKDCFAQDKNTIADMAQLLYGILNGIAPSLPQIVYPENIPAEQ